MGSLFLSFTWGRTFERYSLTLLTESYGSISSNIVWLAPNRNGSISWKERISIHGSTWLLLSTSSTNTMLTWQQLECNCRICPWALMRGSRNMLKMEGLSGKGATSFEWSGNGGYVYGHFDRPFFNLLIRSYLAGFTDIILTGKRIENGIKNEKIPMAAS